MGFMEKRRFRKFLIWVNDLDPENETTWQGINPKTTTMKEVFAKFSLDDNTASFTGHAFALYLNDE